MEEGRGEEARFCWLPLSSVLSPAFLAGERIRHPDPSLPTGVRMSEDGDLETPLLIFPGKKMFTCNFAVLSANLRAHK